MTLDNVDLQVVEQFQQDGSMEHVSEVQWTLLCDPEVVQKLARIRTRDELRKLAYQMESANLDELDTFTQQKAFQTLTDYLAQDRSF